MELMFYDENQDEWVLFDDDAIAELKDQFGENQAFTLEFRFVDEDISY